MDEELTRGKGDVVIYLSFSFSLENTFLSRSSLATNTRAHHEKKKYNKKGTLEKGV